MGWGGVGVRITKGGLVGAGKFGLILGKWEIFERRGASKIEGLGRGYRGGNESCDTGYPCLWGQREKVCNFRA